MTIWHDDERRGGVFGPGCRGVMARGDAGGRLADDWGELSPGMLANVNDEDDHADHPRRRSVSGVGAWGLG